MKNWYVEICSVYGNVSNYKVRAKDRGEAIYKAVHYKYYGPEIYCIDCKEAVEHVYS